VEAADGGVRVHLRVTPRASRNASQGLADQADGAQVLKVAVTAVPEGGKANAAVIALLSKAWHVPKSRIALVAGSADRTKTLFVAGDTTVLLDGIRGWIDSL